MIYKIITAGTNLDRESSLVLFAAERKEVIFVTKSKEDEKLSAAIQTVFEILKERQPEIETVGCVHIMIMMHAHYGELLEADVKAVGLVAKPGKAAEV